MRRSGQPQNLHRKPQLTSSKSLLVPHLPSEPLPLHPPPDLICNLLPRLCTQQSHPLLPVFSFYR